MAIKRPRPGTLPARSWRLRQPRPPPSALPGPHIHLDLFTPADLPAVAAVARLDHLPERMDQSNAAAEMNSGFSDYANAAAMRAADSPAGQRRDWCAGVALAARNLLMMLGHGEGFTEFGRSAFDALHSLDKGWYSISASPMEQASRDRVARLFPIAMPGHNAFSSGDDRAPAFNNRFPELIGRLGPMLDVLSVVAEAGKRGWGGETARGLGDKDRARRHLMGILLGVFRGYFDRSPEASSGSAGYLWFSAAIELAGQRASEQLAGRGAEQGIDRQIQALRATQQIASHIATPKYETATKGKAKLEHWIRDALAPIRNGSGVAGQAKRGSS